MGQEWRMYTPPYIILLIRTFLTLEGIAAQVDKGFNIYEVSLPWAVQRALSPATPKGVGALRSSLLTPQNQLQWGRINDLIAQATHAEPNETAEERVGAARVADAAEGGEGDKGTAADASSHLGSGTSSGRALSTLGVLLGSPEGATLRRICKDVDSTEALMRLASPEMRPIRKVESKGPHSPYVTRFSRPVFSYTSADAFFGRIKDVIKDVIKDATL